MRDVGSRLPPPPEPPDDRRPPTRELAELKATALLAQARIARPPVDIGECARAAGIQLVLYQRLMTLGAVLSVPYGIPSVAVNAAHPVSRQRFSLAHEVGHWVLERAPATHDLAPVAARGRRYDEIERICDYFAGCLLMPRTWIRDRMEWGMTSSEMMKAFGVSYQALTHRLNELGYYSRRGLP